MPEQDKTKLLAKAVRSFMRAADQRINAGDSAAKYDAGSRGHVRATARLSAADAEYNFKHAALEELLKELV